MLAIVARRSIFKDGSRHCSTPPEKSRHDTVKPEPARAGAALTDFRIERRSLIRTENGIDTDMRGGPVMLGAVC